MEPTLWVAGSTPCPTRNAVQSALDRLRLPLDVNRWREALAEHRAALVKQGDQEKVAKFDTAGWDRLPFQIENGRIRVGYHLTWTARWYTSGKSNVQGIPKGVMRDAIRAPERLIVRADWAASHARHLAHVSGDAQLQADLSASGDFYYHMIEWINEGLQVKQSPLGHDRRHDVKKAWNAYLNGEGFHSRAEYLPEAANTLPRVLASRYPQAKAWLDSRTDEVKAADWTFTTPAGTTITIPDTVDEEGRRTREKPLGGTCLQAIEADALGRVVVWADAQPWRLVLSLHDEVVFEVVPSLLDQAKREIEDAMRAATGFTEDLARDCIKVTHGPSWGQQDGSRTPPEVKPTPHTFDVEALALEAVESARAATPKIREWFSSLGIVAASSFCMTGSIPLEHMETHDLLAAGMRCRKPTCAYCGPYDMAVRLHSILTMPILNIVDEDGPQAVGLPLGARLMYLYRIPAPSREAFRRTHQEKAYTLDDMRNLRVPSKESDQKGNRRNSEFFGDGVDGYVVFHLPETSEVAVLSTVSRVYKSAKKPQPIEVRDAETAITSLLTEATTPRAEPDEAGITIPRMPARKDGGRLLSSSQGVIRDPRFVIRMARGAWKKMDSPNMASPKVVATRAKAMGVKPAARKDPQGIIQAVHILRARIAGDPDLLIAALEAGVFGTALEARMDAYRDSIGRPPSPPAVEPDTAMIEAALDALDE